MKNTMHWISVKDGLPEPYVFVLVHEQREKGEPSPTSIARWDGNQWNGLGSDQQEDNSFWSDLFWAIEWDEITHWQSLPSPPEQNSCQITNSDCGWKGEPVIKLRLGPPCYHSTPRCC